MRSLVLAALLSLAAAAPAVAGSSKLDPFVRMALARVRAGASLEALRESGVSVSPARELDVFLVGDVSRAELEAAGARVRTELPGVVTAWLPATAVGAVAALERVQRIEGAPLLEPVLDVSVPTTGATFQRGLGPDFTGLNGEGVIVGVIDTGLDLDHPDFLKPDGTTRLVGLWDQTDNGGPRPSGWSYGTEWTPAQIDAGIARQQDTNGHGTHVLGIAAGDGSATGGTVPAFTYVGMAPRADLVMVKTNFSSTGVVDGVAYVMARATALGKHAVVNLSLGSLAGPKDGTSAFETGLNALATAGHIVVCAAGNDRGRLLHAETVVPAAGTGTITQSLQATTAAGAVNVDGYYESGADLDIRLRSPDGVVIGPIPRGGKNAEYPGQLTLDGWVYIENGVSTTATGDRRVLVEIRVPNPNTNAANPGGTWTYTFENPGGDSVEIDLWTYRRTIQALFVQGMTNEELVIEPANAPDVLTVGAWLTKRDWTDCAGRAATYGDPWTVGVLAGFSAPGPTRDGRQKPEITGPGVGIGGANTFDIPVTCAGEGTSPFLDDGMRHTINEGTSMSAPHAAGAVALLLQKFGALTPAQVKSHLFANAVHDAHTGATWNQDWGHGKLALGDLTDPVALVRVPNGGESFAIGATASIEWSATDAYGGVTAVDVAVRRAAGPWETIATGIPNTGDHVWTVTGPPSAEARLRVTAHDAAGNHGEDLGDAVFAITDAVGAPPGAALEWALAFRGANPARGPVDVDFAVPRATALTVTVHDLAGREVASLASGAHEAGRHRARWTPGRNASGVYFVRLRAPGRELARRIAIVR